MKLQAKKLGGDATNSRNIIETRIVFEENEQLEKGAYSVVHTIEHVKGSTVTHGGGAEAGQYLHYKSNETDVDEDGDIDYSSTTLHTEMQYYGLSEIKAVAKVTDLSKLAAFQKEWADWNEVFNAYRKEVNERHGPTLEAEKLIHFWEDDNPAPEDLHSTVEIKSGNILLEWTHDFDSSWV